MVAGSPVPSRTGSPPPGRDIRARARATWDRHGAPRLRVLVAREHRGLTVPLLAITAMSSIGTVLSPALIRWPLLLCLLSPRLPFLLLAADSSPAVVFLVLATARLCLADPFHFLLGRRMAGTETPQSRLTRLLGRIGPAGIVIAVLVRPIGRHLFAAGVLRARPAIVTMTDVVGTLTFLGVVHAGMSI